MNLQELQKMETKELGKNIIFYEEIDSTQKEMKRKLQKEKLQNGTIIITENQTEGIGTHNRKWFSKKEKNITMTFVWYPNCKIQKLENLTIEIAENIQKAIKNICNIELEIKRPNDLMLNGKKVGGILTECVSQNEFVKYVICGMGINVNQEEFEEEVKDIATSLKKENNEDYTREKIIKEICLQLEKNILVHIS